MLTHVESKHSIPGRGGSRTFMTGVKMRFSGYYKCQSFQNGFSPFHGGL